MYLQSVKVGRVLALFLLICTLSAAKCSDDQIRKAAQTADGIAVAVKGCLDVADQLKAEQKITFAQWQDINRKLLVVNSATQVFLAEVAKAKAGGVWDNNVKAALAASFVTLNEEIRTINSAGVFQISDPDAHKRLQTVLTALNTAAGLMAALLA